MSVSEGGTSNTIEDIDLREELVGIKPKKVEHKKVTKVSWIPYTISVLAYFVSKLISEAADIPVDMYVFVIIIAGLMAYNHHIRNK